MHLAGRTGQVGTGLYVIIEGSVRVVRGSDELAILGPGDFFGTRQSGLPRLRTGDLVRDRDIMEAAHEEARRLVNEGGLSAELLQFVQQRWEEQFGLIQVG